MRWEDVMELLYCIGGVCVIWLIIIVRIAIYFVHKKKTIEQITSDEGNREALDHFFNF